MIHTLKTEKQYFEATIKREKLFEVRKNDRDFRKGDFIALNEINESGEYTGRFAISEITYILKDSTFVKEGYAVLGIQLREISSGEGMFQQLSYLIDLPEVAR